MSLTGWSLYSKEVTTPKLPPPPRIAQNRSSFSRSLATRRRPSAVTTSAETRLSHERPKPRARCPMPPPRGRPGAPVDHRIEASSRLLVVLVTWRNHFPPHTLPQLFYRGLGHGCSSFRRSAPSSPLRRARAGSDSSSGSDYSTTGRSSRWGGEDG